MNRPPNEPVSFHVGGRANTGFNTHDNDRATLASDFVSVHATTSIYHFSLKSVFMRTFLNGNQLARKKMGNGAESDA